MNAVVSVGVCPEACTRRVALAEPCTACADACPAGALSLRGGTVRMESSACVACGACVAACREDVFEDRLWTEDDLAAWGAGPGAEDAGLLLACSRDEHASASARRVPCLGRLTPGSLLAMLDRGAARIEIRRPDCDACAWAPAGRVLDRTLEVVDALSPVIGLAPDAVRVVPADKDGGAAASGDAATGDRRGFLRAAIRVAGAAIRVAGAAAASWIPEPRFFAARGTGSRTALLHVLRRASPLQPVELPRGLVPFAHLDLDDGCDGCAACARVCAPEALVVERGDDKLRVRFHPQACTGCGLCEAVCWRGLLRIAATVDPARVFEEDETVILDRRGVSCDACGSFVAHGAAGCSFCRRRLAPIEPAGVCGGAPGA